MVAENLAARDRAIAVNLGSVAVARSMPRDANGYCKCPHCGKVMLHRKSEAIAAHLRSNHVEHLTSSHVPELPASPVDRSVRTEAAQAFTEDRRA